MNTAEWILVIVGFTGWTVTLVALMRSVLPMAEGFSTLHKLSRFVDDRVLALLERTERLRGRLPNEAPKPPKHESRGTNPATESLNDIFGGSRLLEPMDDQPDPDGLELVN